MTDSNAGQERARAQRVLKNYEATQARVPGWALAMGPDYAHTSASSTSLELTEEENWKCYLAYYYYNWRYSAFDYEMSPSIGRFPQICIGNRRCTFAHIPVSVEWLREACQISVGNRHMLALIITKIGFTEVVVERARKTVGELTDALSELAANP